MADGVGAGADERLRLSKERVLRSAVALADRDGVELLSMRHLARELGVGVMSLYHYVANKDDLLDAMVDVVYGEIGEPAGDLDWKTAMRERSMATRGALLRHPWATALMESRVSPGPANMRHHDTVLGILRRAGFSVRMAVHAYNLLDSYIYGFALQEKNLPFGTEREHAAVTESILETMRAEEYPYLSEVGIQLVESRYEYAHEFDFGLDLILDGLEKLPRSGEVGTPTAPS
jgi:AcrR family transcriptional regulator